VVARALLPVRVSRARTGKWRPRGQRLRLESGWDCVGTQAHGQECPCHPSAPAFQGVTRVEAEVAVEGQAETRVPRRVDSLGVRAWLKEWAGGSQGGTRRLQGVTRVRLKRVEVLSFQRNDIFRVSRMRALGVGCLVAGADFLLACIRSPRDSLSGESEARNRRVYVVLAGGASGAVTGTWARD
jgi:hypothetical protein